MASGPSNGQGHGRETSLEFYPAYCHPASPTYFTWVKLTAHDVHHALRRRRGFEQIGGPSHSPAQLLFYLNHPVQFVYLVGVVVAFDEYFDRFWLFTLDDSSGETVDVTCRKPEPIAQQNALSPAAATAAAASTSAAQQPNKDAVEQDGRQEMISQLDIGKVVKVKGTIGTFRNVRQIQLERMSYVRDTSEEVRFWEQRTSILADVLGKPWVVSTAQRKRLQAQAQGDVERDRGREARRRQKKAKRQAREAKDADDIRRQYEMEERERRRGADIAREHGMDLRPRNSPGLTREIV